IAGHRVAVVAHLRRAHDAVAAVHQMQARRARRDADPAGLDLTARIAAIAGHRIAVVALLAGLQVAVAAPTRSVGRRRVDSGVGPCLMTTTTRENQYSREREDVAHAIPIVAPRGPHTLFTSATIALRCDDCMLWSIDTSDAARR